MLQRECNQMGIMDKIPGHSALLKHFAQDCLMARSFRKNANDRRLQESAQRFPWLRQTTLFPVCDVNALPAERFRKRVFGISPAENPVTVKKRSATLSETRSLPYFIHCQLIAFHPYLFPNSMNL